jgi:predicted membrane-bound dolichyl-phosphate-mannose-protein mannosyltransferase
MTVLELAPVLAGYILAVIRLANAARPVWTWLPNWLQVALPGILVALVPLAQQVGRSETKLDLAVALVMVFGALGTAARGVGSGDPESIEPLPPES